MKIMPSVPARRWAALLVLVLVSACQNLVESGPSTIRVHNATGITLTDVEISSGFPSIRHAMLIPGQVTEYVSVPMVYEAFTRVVARAGDREIHQQMVDRMNDEPLRPGVFTARFEFRPDGSLDMRLVRDD